MNKINNNISRLSKIKMIVVITIIFSVLSMLCAEPVGLNKQQLVDKIKANFMEKITGDIVSAVQKGEQQVADKTYYSKLLEPYEAYGLNPNDPNLLNSLWNIHTQIKSEIEKDPSTTYSAGLSSKVSDLLRQGVITKVTSMVDPGSQEIISGLNNLISSGSKRMTDLATAADRIGNLDVTDEDYDLEVTKILKDYGIKSDYFYKIDELERSFKIINGKIAEPLKAFNMVREAMNSNDPAFKIQMLFEIGETFSGKVPILGPLLEPLFTLAKGVLKAARGLETVLEKNLNQGCIAGEGTYREAGLVGKKAEFVKLFPHVVQACPISTKVYSPVYNNIYYDVKVAGELFFYIKNKWKHGKNDKYHDGADDIRGMITWLRRNDQIKKATDLEFLYKSYQKEYGITYYKKQIEEKLKEIGELLRPSYQSVNYCDSDKLEKFYMRTIGLDWFNKLLRYDDFGGFSFNEVNTFSTRYSDIIKQMIKHYYIRNGRHNLNQLNNITKKLSEKTPIEISGYVEGESSNKISNVEIDVSGASIYDFGSNCKKTTTDESGEFRFYVLLPLNSSISLSLTAKPEEGETATETVTVDPTDKRHWVVNFFLEEEEEECGANEEWSDSQKRCVCKDGYEEDENGDCVEKEEDHNCKANEEWSDSQDKCVCKDGFLENANKDCIKVKDCGENEHFDVEVPDCVCNEGFTENEEGKCVSDDEEVMDECSLEYIKALTFMLEVLVADTKLRETELISNINKFNKEINDQSSDICGNQTVGDCYATASRLVDDMAENVSDIHDIAVEILMLQAMCPDLTAQMQSEGLTVKNLISSIAGVGTNTYRDKLAEMSSRLGENGCDEDESKDDGEKVVPPDGDAGFGGAGGWFTEIPGDGEDNDGDGQQDEEIQDVTGKNIALVIYDSGSAKDDVFSLSVSGYGVLGQTQAGGRKYFRLNLMPGKTYTATVHVIIAPDDVGTYTLTIYYKGHQIEAISGSPPQGSSASLTFTVPAK